MEIRPTNPLCIRLWSLESSFSISCLTLTGDYLELQYSGALYTCVCYTEPGTWLIVEGENAVLALLRFSSRFSWGFGLFSNL